MAAKAMGKDKRRSRRRALRRSAWVALGPNDLHGCTLSDISDVGARIELDDPGTIPDRFMLFLSNNGAARRSCHVVWRTSQQVGVRFDPQVTRRKRGRPHVALGVEMVDVSPRGSETHEKN
jgi:hypothetical protein